ncbi:MAG TPA: aryl-sulfate sulfotransferase [Pseudogracilibacillus sp.]|nr:aryl-sulfate sulfotransferase [Pseudogracilibacillus sp.]
MRRNSIFLLSILLLVFFGLVACADNDTADTEKEEKKIFDPEPNTEAAQISSYNQERMDEQADMDADILAEYKEDSYTVKNPFVKLDPYDTSPLSALVMFETQNPVTTEVSIGGEKYAETITNKWEKAETQHVIPVLGLYPGQDNKVEIIVTNEEGETTKSEVTITTDALPDDFMETTLVEAHQEAMADGLTYIVPTSGYLYAVDANADVRWYSSERSRLIFTRLNNGHYLQTTRQDDEKQYNELIELDMLGKLHHAYHIDIQGYDENEDNLIHHEVIEMPNGNLLATTHEPDSDYVEDHMHEIDRETGKTTQEINLRDVMPGDAPDDYDGKNSDINDWIHQNAIWFDESDESILISGRSQDIILKVSYPEGELKWILGADEKWPEDYKDYLLEPKGDVKFPAGQHAMKFVDKPNSQVNPNIKDMILFDNNEVFMRGDRDISEDYSQAIRYQIDEEAMTVEQTWAYGEDRGESFFSHIIGNVQYLYDDDNIILNSGATKDENSPTGTTGRVVEVDANDADSGEIFELEIQGKDPGAVEFTYRTWRLPLYPDREWDFSLES